MFPPPAQAAVGSCCFNPRSPLPPGRPPAWGESSAHTPARPLRTHAHIATLSALGRCVPPAGTRSALFKPSSARPGPCAALGPARSLITNSVSFLSSSPPPPPRQPCSRPVSLAPPSPRPDPPRRLPLPRSLGSRDGDPVVGTAPPHGHPVGSRGGGAPGEPGTALLAPLVLGLGLVLACLGLLLAVGQPGGRASLFAQVRPRLHTPPWDCAEHLMGPVGRGGERGQEGGWRVVRCQSGEGQGSCLLPSRSLPRGTWWQKEDGPLVSGGGCWLLVAGHGKCVPRLCSHVCVGCVCISPLMPGVHGDNCV